MSVFSSAQEKGSQSTAIQLKPNFEMWSRRRFEQMLEHRLNGTSSVDAKFFEMKQGSHQAIRNAEKWSMLNFASKRMKVLYRIPKIMHIALAGNRHFDPSLHGAVAPDHFL